MDPVWEDNQAGVAADVATAEATAGAAAFERSRPPPSRSCSPLPDEAGMRMPPHICNADFEDAPDRSCVDPVLEDAAVDDTGSDNHRCQGFSLELVWAWDWVLTIHPGWDCVLATFSVLEFGSVFSAM